MQLIKIAENVQEGQQHVAIMTKLVDTDSEGKLITICNSFIVDYILRKENLEVSNISINRSCEVSGFTYKGVFVVFNEFVNEVISICDKLNVPFQNQSIRDLPAYFGVRLPSSTLNKNVYDLITDLPFGAIIDIRHDADELYEYDQSKAYTNAFLNTRYRRYFYESYNDFETVNITDISQIKRGHYLIGQLEHSFLYKQMLLNDRLLIDYYNMGYLKLNEITHYIEPDGILEPEIFHRIRDTIFENADIPFSEI